jgi:hypothetical protein
VKIYCDHPDGFTCDTTVNFRIRICEITLTSLGADNQTVCQNTPIDPITYYITGITSNTELDIDNLPNGLEWDWNNAKNEITIYGTPAEATAGSQTYTITIIGGSCKDEVTTGTIKVNSRTPVAFSPTSYCNTPPASFPSTNGVSGTWSPSSILDASQNYTFTPNASECANVGGTWNVTKETKLTVIYDSNDEGTGGIVPIDGNAYCPESEVTVKSPGPLVRIDYFFRGWATDPEAEDPDYLYENNIFNISTFIITEDTTLYAVWGRIGCVSPPVIQIISKDKKQNP